MQCEIFLTSLTKSDKFCSDTNNNLATKTGLLVSFELKKQTFQWFWNICIFKRLLFEATFNLKLEDNRVRRVYKKIIPIIYYSEFSSILDWAI